jgi:hypothetical protein
MPLHHSTTVTQRQAISFLPSFQTANKKPGKFATLHLSHSLLSNNNYAASQNLNVLFER